MSHNRPHNITLIPVCIHQQLILAGTIEPSTTEHRRCFINRQDTGNVFARSWWTVDCSHDGQQDALPTHMPIESIVAQESTNQYKSAMLFLMLKGSCEPEYMKNVTMKRHRTFMLRFMDNRTISLLTMI